MGEGHGRCDVCAAPPDEGRGNPIHRQLARISAHRDHQRAAHHLHARHLPLLGGRPAAPLPVVADHVIDDSLEWTGTGKEMFFGFLIVMCVLAPFFLFFQFLFPALDRARHRLRRRSAVFLFYLGIIYLGGFARFRALRYRLSRTLWHGIRGGSDDPGWSYGAEYLGRYSLPSDGCDRIAVGFAVSCGTRAGTR